MRLRFLLALLPIVLFSFAAAAQWCATGELKSKSISGGWGIVDAQDRVVIPFDNRPVVVLTDNLIKVSPTHIQPKWGLLNRQARLLLPQEYDELELAGCPYVGGRRGAESFLFDENGQVLLREAGNHRFMVYPKLNRVVASHIGQNGHVDAIKILTLSTKKPVYALNPASGAYPLRLDLARGRGPEKTRFLPFFEVSVSEPGSGGSKQNRRVLDLQGKVLFDSIDAGIDTDYQRGLVYLRTRTRPMVLTDTLLRPIKFLSYKYNWVSPIGPNQRWWAVNKDGKSGVLDKTGKVILPVKYPGQLHYAGNNNFLLSEYRNNVLFRSIITADQRLIDLGDYYIERGIDSTLAKQPLLLKHQKAYKMGVLDLQRGFIVPVRYDLLAETQDGFLFFQQDSAGYLDRQGKVRLLTPACQMLSAFHEGYAICGKLVPNASRAQYPSAQIIYSTERGPTAVQFAYMDASGKLISGYFDWAGPFQDGYATVIKDNEPFMIDTKGKKVTFANNLVLVSYFKQGLAVARQGNRYGLVDKTGRLMLPAEYQQIETERLRQSYVSIVAKGSRDNNLQPITVPKITEGMVDVVTGDGRKSRVAVEVAN